MNSNVFKKVMSSGLGSAIRAVAILGSIAYLVSYIYDLSNLRKSPSSNKEGDKLT